MQSIYWLGYWLDETACNSCRLEAIFPFSKASRLALRPKQPPFQLVNKVISPFVKQPGMMVTTHFNLVLRLSISGCTLLFPLYACMEYTVTLPVANTPIGSASSSPNPDTGIYFLAFPHTSQSTPSLWRWNWHSVPKRRPTTIWRRGNTQKNIYSDKFTFIYNTCHY